MPSTVLEGFSRDNTTGALITADVAAAVAPFSDQDGFLFDANYALVTVSLAGTTTPQIERGFLRETAANANYDAIVSVPFASAVGGTSVQEGFLRDGNYSLVTVTVALASGTTGYQQGFLRDANYALVIP